MDSSRRYFATRPRNEIGPLLVERLQAADKSEREHGTREEEENAYRHVYGQDYGAGITSGVQRDGAQGELTKLRVNKARALAKAFEALVLGPKLTWRPMARNADANAQRAVTTGQHLLEDYWKNKSLSRVVATWVSQAVEFASAYVFPEWDKGAGPTFAALPPSEEMPQGKLVKAGDVTFHNLLPWDVFRDARARSQKQLDWHFIRLPKNRHDLALLYPRLSDGRDSHDAILAASDPLASQSEHEEDTAFLYYFFHRSTPSLPLGREVLFLSADCILSDSRLSYDDYPLYRLAADDMHGTANAWTSFWDTLGVQELRDGIESSIASNIAALGVQSLALQAGSELTADSVGGLRVWRYPQGANKPEAVQLTQQPREAFEHLDSLDSSQRQLMGLNDVALGQPDTAQMNAQAFAVLASMAVQQASPFQSSVVDAVSRLGTGVLKTLRKRVSGERTLQVTGRTSKHLYAERKYTGRDLEPVESVLVEIGNPLEQTPSGRSVILQHYIDLGFVKSPEMYQQVVETGRLEPATRADRDAHLLLAAEYEALSSGEVPIIHAVHDHPLHYREHAAVLHNPENLRNPEVVNAVQAHLDQHYLEFFGVPPGQDLLYPDRVRLMLGQQPPGAAQMMGAPPGGNGAPPGAQPSEMPSAPSPLDGPSMEQPNLPDNPLSGEQFAPGQSPIA